MLLISPKACSLDYIIHGQTHQMLTDQIQKQLCEIYYSNLAVSKQLTSPHLLPLALAITVVKL